MAAWLRHIAKQIIGAVASRVSSGTASPSTGTTDEVERRIRSMLGGQISPPPLSITRWHLSDLEDAIHEADCGDITKAAQLCREVRRDGIVNGVLSTRANGLVRLPRRFSGDPEVCADLAGADGEPGIFDEIFPSAELGLLVGDGILLGIGVAEFVDTPAGYPVLRRLNPEWLTYRWSENTWYYRSVAGDLKITPGDGRWVLHCPGGVVEPWDHGLFAAVGKSVIHKTHAELYRENYSSKLANAARVATAPAGASDEQHESWFRRVAAWGINTVFSAKPGYDVKIVESNGQGYQVFKETIKKGDEDNIVAIAGQLPTTTGGAGFSNIAVHETIRGDIISGDGEGLSTTISSQGLPHIINLRHGGGPGQGRRIRVNWDTRPPTDLKAEAEAMEAGAKAIVALDAAAAPHGQITDIRLVKTRLALPLREIQQVQRRMIVGKPWCGLKPVIEFPAGSTQTGVGPDGTEWSRTFAAPYGYLVGIVGQDGEEVDVYLGPDPYAKVAYVIEQMTSTGQRDEDKVMLGFLDAEISLAVYSMHVPSWCVGVVHEVPVVYLAEWLASRVPNAVAA